MNLVSTVAVATSLILNALPLSAATVQVSTATGNGADVEFRENLTDSVFTESTSNGTTQNTRTSGGGDRNEVVGLKFDLSGYAFGDVTNVTLNLFAYRLDNNTREVSLYGVAQGTVSGSGNFDTETWNESASLYGDLPGLLSSDGDCTTQNLNTAALTSLGSYTIAGSQPEGTLHTFDDPAIMSFIQSYSGSDRLTFILAANNQSSGQFRTATSEATQTATGVLSGSVGDFAPYLEFEAPAVTAGDLVITNTVLTAEGLVLSGTGGTNNGPFLVLANNDLTIPSTNWPAISTNSFDAQGNFAVTNPFNLATPQQFFQLLTTTLPIEEPDFSLIGFATVAGETTGGEGGLTQTVSTASAFTSAVQANEPRVVLVDGFIELNGGVGNVNINSDKSIIGLGTNAAISGQLQVSGESNVIIRNLTISNSGEPSTLDGVRIVNNAHHVWVDHCTFVDCSDGSVDITGAADYVTVSWCKFTYVNQTEHRFANLIAGSDTDAGDYRITFHNNWWSTGSDQRMPMSRYGTVHLFNNYYFAPGNSYCSNARTNAQFFSEHNFYRQVDDPIYKESNGRIRIVGNIYQGTTGRIDQGTDTLDAILTPPPYSYTPAPTVDVPNIVTNYAGVGRGPFAP